MLVFQIVTICPLSLRSTRLTLSLEAGYFPNLPPRPSHGSGLESIPDIIAIVAPG